MFFVSFDPSRCIQCLVAGANKVASWLNTDANAVGIFVTKQAIGEGLLAVISLKLNWWAGNHHVGQGVWEGFSCKVWTGLKRRASAICQGELPAEPPLGKNQLPHCKCD